MISKYIVEDIKKLIAEYDEGKIPACFTNIEFEEKLTQLIDERKLSE